MKRSLLIISFLLMFTSPVLAAGPKTYQVTGPILEITSDTIAVQKGNDKWVIVVDAFTQMSGDMKIGRRVTVEYTMRASIVEVNDGAKKAEPRRQRR